MTDHLPRLRRLRSTAQIFREAASSFNSNLFTFLLLSLLLLSFRLVLENGTHLVTSIIDHDPSLNALLSRLDPPDSRSPAGSSQDSSTSTRRRRRRPFLHLTRVGTLDEDFFSGDGDEDRSLFGANKNFSPNRSFVMFNDFDSVLGFSDSVVDSGVSVSEVVRPGVAFRLRAEIASLAVDNDSAEDQEEEYRDGNGQPDVDRVVDLQFVVKGLELDHRETAALFFLLLMT
ncbi:uncharacterized protein LOC111013548 [Momordica charantia]|uniref:Uncharacterized protein LOC111013548 n=1 Tax=Momordica charantia TaxID=3673 RepID=A0A6J1CPI7_MOMCH|nr:uncharacterized protein LOC111013548 [Momordica charantia]